MCSGLGLALVARCDYTQAEKAFKKELKVAASTDETYLNIARMYEAKGDLDVSCSHRERERERVKTHTERKSNIARMNEAKGDRSHRQRE